MKSPDHAGTLIDLLQWWASKTPNAPALRFDGTELSYSDLFNGARQVAHSLAESDVCLGDRVVLVLPNGTAFFHAFFGAILAGGIPVPIYPQSNPERCERLARLADSSALIVPSDLSAERIDAFADHMRTTHIKLIFAGSSMLTKPDHDFVFKPQAEDIAFIQYTSGSTDDPRGVPLTHENLLVNIRQMIDGMLISTEDKFVSWLPVYHDMGLILMALVPLYLGKPTTLLPASLRSPRGWLRTIEQIKGTFTAAPDIAYRLCTSGIRDHESYDLASLRVALNAAEPVRISTIETFEKVFRLKNVMTAGYGLAEATVGVSMSKPGYPCKVDSDRRVSVGKPFVGIDIRIVGEGKVLPTGDIGEIAVRSPAATSGYLNNPVASERMWWNEEYLLTGDLGYLDSDGDLFIVSRKKNVIIQAGRSFYPADIELSVSSLPHLRHVAAIGIDRGRVQGEQLYVFGELNTHRRFDTSVYEDLIISVVDRIHGSFGIRPARVFLLKPHTIPFTPNGKMQHKALREQFIAGALHRADNIVFPTDAPASR